MAKESYVARGPIKHGLPSGEMLYLDEGDPLPAEMTDEEVLNLRAAGAAVPKRVYDALRAAENAQADAEEAQRQAELEMQNANTGAAQQLADAQSQLEQVQAEASTGPSRAAGPVGGPPAQPRPVSQPLKAEPPKVQPKEK